MFRTELALFFLYVEPTMNSILSGPALSKTITRLSYEIIEGCPDTSNLILLGILTRGATLARRMSTHIFSIKGVSPIVESLDVSRFRDDKTTTTALVSPPSPIMSNTENRHIILIDDVMYTGRTMLAAMDAIKLSGRPRLIQLAVLIDRGHRQMPLRPEYVGKNVPTSLTEHVRVKLSEVDGTDGVILEKRKIQ
jgi:pyrimidine operon attenuation protein/uracil phosphoribosyltransferase